MVLMTKIPSGCDLRNLDPMSCDRCILNLLSAHLIQEERAEPECSYIQQILWEFKQALDEGGVISLAIDGQVQFMTPRAAELLKQYYTSCPPYVLPDFLNRWFKYQISQLELDGSGSSANFPLYVEQADRQLIIRLIPNAISDRYLLFLEERELPTFSVPALEFLGLTKREAEVLFWIAKDKSNAGIARAIGCCEGTVRKHLENLYKKLGVQTRMGAVMVALEKLGILRSEYISKSS